MGMGTASRTEGRERVLREAQRLFVERGFAEVSMQQIADAAGLTKAALYYHFKDKEDLFGHVMRREMERVRGGVAAALRGEGSLRDHLTAVIRFVLASARSDFGRLMQDMKEHLSEQKLRALNCQAEPPYDLLRPRLERARAEGEIRPDLDLDFALSLFFGMVFSQLREARLGAPAPEPAVDVPATIVEVLLHGIAAGGSTPRRAARSESGEG